MIGAGVALLTALSYAEMATTFPSAGAEYIYIRHTWPGADWLAFGVGVTILLGGAAMATTVALAFGGWRLRERSWPRKQSLTMWSSTAKSVRRLKTW